MAKNAMQTVSIALVEADAALAVLDGAIREKLTDAERKLVVKAREMLAVAEGRVNEVRSLARQTMERL